MRRSGIQFILIVEDSSTKAEQLRYILEKRNYSVTAAANGREALIVIAGGKPGLVISDIIMPEMDGFELCRRIKAREETCDIPVMLLTSLSDPQVSSLFEFATKYIQVILIRDDEISINP